MQASVNTQSFRTLSRNISNLNSHISALAPGDAMNADQTNVRPLCWSPTQIRSVCRSTSMAETRALSHGVEHGLCFCRRHEGTARYPMMSGSPIASVCLTHDIAQHETG